MINRYYYDDPLAAAWMVDEHGLIAVGSVPAENISEAGGIKISCQTVEWYFPGDGARLIVDHTTGQIFGNIGIRNDTLHILKPQEGDLFKNLNYYRIINSDAGCKARFGTLIDAQISLCCDDFEFQIIQRNGIPFHWPKRESI